MTMPPATPPDEHADLGAGRGPDWLDAALAAQLPSLIALRRDIHAHPELSRREARTTAAVADALATAGIASTVLPGGTGLIADLAPGSGPRDAPAIALRADLDALPLTEESGLPFASTVDGVAHACGHDVHTTVLVGAALALRAAPSLPVPVRLIFQPAEEVMPGGANDVVAAGALDGVRRAYALHCDPSLPVGRIGSRVGPITSACDMIRISLAGPGGHTSRPHLTVDLVGALAAVAAELPHLVARHLPPAAIPTLVWGAIGAGEAANVIPRRGTLSGTLRIADRAAWTGAQTVVRALVAQVLAPFGAEHTVDYAPGVPPAVNDEAAEAALRAGVARALGPSALATAEQSSGAEDFAIILDRVPGSLARLGVWDGTGRAADLHSTTFRADERAIGIGVRTLVHAVLASAAESGGA